MSKLRYARVGPSSRCRRHASGPGASRTDGLGRPGVRPFRHFPRSRPI